MRFWYSISFKICLNKDFEVRIFDAEERAGFDSNKEILGLAEVG